LKTGQKDLQQTIETLAIEQAETRKRTMDNEEELKTVNDKIAKTADDNYQQRKIGKNYNASSIFEE
jgi:hypothetical protein